MNVFIKRFSYDTDDKKAKRILDKYIKENEKLLSEIREIFNKEKTVTPQAFSDKDIFKDAPKLFDYIFHIMFLRIMMRISLGFSAINLSISYRNDIREFYESAIKVLQDTYGTCTDYLTEQGVLAKPPYITMPKEVEFIEGKKYMSGVQLFGNKRALNTIEISFLFLILEVNVFGMQLMTGFAQVAKENEAREYFIKGKELAKKIVSDISSIMLQSDIQPPSTWVGKATDSVIPPFSDKTMMYCTNIMASFALGNNALGVSFGMRSDLPAKLAVISKDTLDLAREGGKLMIKHKWLEEPPQMEDRSQLMQTK